MASVTSDPINSGHADMVPPVGIRRWGAPQLRDDLRSSLMAEAKDYQLSPTRASGARPDTQPTRRHATEPRQDDTQRQADRQLCPPDEAPRVLWTRSAQCRALAETLGGESALQAGADVAAACIHARAALLVARQLTSFDLCSIAVPHGYDPDTARSIVAAVGGGPHSHLAAAIAHRLSQQLGIPARAVYGHRHSDEQPKAQALLAAITTSLPGLAAHTVQTSSPAAMVQALPAGTLLVVGAPGGTWFQRQFFGRGARIQAKAPGGTIVVKHNPARIYQIMRPPTAFGPHMRVADAAHLSPDRHVIVAQDGQLLGIAPSHSLHRARPDEELQHVMEDPVHLNATEYLDSATELITHHHPNPIPVIDTQTRLIGTVTAADLSTRTTFVE